MSDIKTTKKANLLSAFNSLFWISFLANFVLICSVFLPPYWHVNNVASDASISMWTHSGSTLHFSYFGIASFFLLAVSIFFFIFSLVSNVKNKNFKLSLFKLISLIFIVVLFICFLTSKLSIENTKDIGWIFSLNEKGSVIYSKLGLVVCLFAFITLIISLVLFFLEKKYIAKQLLKTEK
ncbi:MAG: hypothetical protein LBF02_01655 [Mycoplasmataceae bacterium]|nr:hypothetical protein [Mycoplasmataceae bacterium]